jgi:signal transduction histidine kinase
VAAGAALLLVRMREQRLPYKDSFSNSRAGEWRAFGGVWRLKDGMVINRSDERGAKITTGSPDWSDYQMTADMEMLGHGGDIGILLRVNAPETGINSYRGYYIGIRSGDNALITGAADHDWLEGRPVAINGGVHSGTWYRVHAVMVGCDLAAQVTNLKTGQRAWAALHDDACLRVGQIGLRSLATGAAWRNVEVTTAIEADLQSLRGHAEETGRPEYPSREDDYARMKQAFSGKQNSVSLDSVGPDGRGRRIGDSKSMGEYASLPLRSIKSLNITRSGGSAARLRGVVTLADPLYVQDETAGISVHLLQPASLNLGDELELSGRAMTNGTTSFFEASALQLLWDRTPIAPVSISSTQAASGAFEGSLVELSGELVSKHISADGTITLELADIAQHFRVTVPQGLSDTAFRRLQEGSDLRVSGICSSEPGSSATEIPFSILPRSVDDIKVISGPPWNRGTRLLYLVAAGIALALAAAYLYLQAERWKMRAILQERERLAMDMHDTLAQSFAGVGFHLQSMRKGLREQSTVPSHLMRKLDVACEITAHTHREASARIAALHPSAEIDGDLLTLLQRSTTAMLNGAHLPLELQRSGEPRQLSMPVRDALFRIGREGIANVLRHSKATKLTLALYYEEKRVRLLVVDNGVGFDALETRKGFGLQSIAARADDVGAVAEVQTAPGQGTSVAVSAPYGRRFSLYEWLRFQWERLRVSLCRGGRRPDGRPW